MGQKYNYYTMLQKLLKCKGFTVLKFDDFTATQILRKIKFLAGFKRSKIVIFGNFKGSDFGC